MEHRINDHTLRLIQGDITKVQADAIVNAANSQLLRGGGVCGAIHAAGGSEIERECAAVGFCATGNAVATGAGRLPVRHVIHAVAPIWRGGMEEEPELLASAYRRSLDVAEEMGDRTVAFPSLGTGIYGYPIEQAAPIALQTVIDHLQGPGRIDEVTFVLFSPSDLAAYQEALARLLPPAE